MTSIMKHSDMDLTTPLSAVTPTLDAHVLTVLARSRASLTGRQIRQLSTTGSLAGIQLTLARLVTTGVVQAEPAGRAIMYRLNREHLLADAILAIAGARTELTQRLRDRITSWPIPCKHASIFGSVARGESGPDSDLDVLVVRDDAVDPNDATWTDQLSTLELDVTAWTGNTLAWFETTADGLRLAVARKEPIVQSWHDDGIWLAGESFASLARVQVAR
jgi:predicted nucleotidyltransferase